MKSKLKWAFILVFAFFFAYWVKCQLGIDLFKSFHLTNVLPVQCLQRSEFIPISPAKNSVFIDDDFEHDYGNWSKLSAIEKGAVDIAYVKGGLNDSRCLLVQSVSKKDWSLQNRLFVAAKPGEVFSYDGYVKTQGPDAKVQFSIVLYDADKQVKESVYVPSNAATFGRWVNLTDRFTIPAGVGFFHFRISGRGVGKTWVDMIKLSKY